MISVHYDTTGRIIKIGYGDAQHLSGTYILVDELPAERDAIFTDYSVVNGVLTLNT